MHENDQPDPSKQAERQSHFRARFLVPLITAISLAAILVFGFLYPSGGGDEPPEAPAAAATGNQRPTTKPSPQPPADTQTEAQTGNRKKTKALQHDEPKAAASADRQSGQKAPTAEIPASAPPSTGLADRGGSVPAAAPQHLIIEAAGIHVPILPLTPSAGAMAEQSLVPPFTLNGYWITAYGKPGQGSQNTTYITGHSWSDRLAPFDRLSTHTEVGDRITLLTAEGKLTYVVETITTHNKETLKTSEIWAVVPNRLVLISCYTQDPNGKNVVVTAAPAP